MNLIVGAIAIAFGCWLMWLTFVRGWHGVYGSLGAPMIIGGYVLILSGTIAPATPANSITFYGRGLSPSLVIEPVERDAASR